MRKLITVLLLFISTLQAAEGGAFLKLGYGARALSMGKAFTSLASDTYAPYWNPAGLGKLDKTSYTLTSHTWNETNSVYFGNVTHLNEKYGSLGFAYINYSMAPMELYDSTGTYLGKSSDIGDQALFLSYGRSYGDFALGTSLKYITSRLVYVEAKGVGVDLGVLYRFDITERFDLKEYVYPITLGFHISDFGDTKLDWGEAGTDTISQQNRLGVSTFTWGKSLLMSLDYWMLRNRPDEYHFGFEYFASRELSLRIGLEDDVIDSEGGKTEKTLSFGSSLKYDDFEIDYTLSFHPQDTMSFFSVNYVFGREVKTPAEIELVRRVTSLELDAKDLIRAKRYQEAKKVYYQLVEIAPVGNNYIMDVYKMDVLTGKVHENLGDSFLKEIDYEGALYQYKKAVYYDPNNQAAKDKIQKIEDLLAEESEVSQFFKFGCGRSK